MLQKSPSGSLCPYYLMGGELHPLKYDSFHDRKADLFAIMKAEEEFILKSSGTHNRRIWIDLYETTLDHEVIGALVLHVKTIEPKIDKLCFVGCSLIQAGKIRKMMKQKVPNLHKIVRFHQDPEEAKKWLIREAY